MPKQIDLAEQRRTIARAAIDVIGQSGLEGTRLRDVARAADVTTGAVTHYFDGKEEVLEAALAEIVRRTLERMDRPVPDPGNRDAFIARAATYLPVDEESRREWRVWLAFWGRAVADQRLRAIHRDYYMRIVERLADWLALLIDGGPRPSRERLRHCADAMVAAIDGVGIRATLEPEPWTAKRQKETLASLLRPLLDSLTAGRSIA